MNISPAAALALIEGNLDNFIAAATPGGIEAQEKSGQIQKTFDNTLPKRGTLPGAGRESFEALGFVFGSDADDLFVNVTFPNGWRKRPAKHSMHLHLLDDKGRKRASIFYKAAFYDRQAEIWLEKRFRYAVYEKSGTEEEYPVRIFDCDSVIHELGSWKRGDSKRRDELSNAASKWLDERYPNWKDQNAYWD